MAVTAPAYCGQSNCSRPSTSSCRTTSLAIAPPKSAAARGSTSFENVDAAAHTRSKFRSVTTVAMVACQWLGQRIAECWRIHHEHRGILRRVRGKTPSTSAPKSSQSTSPPVAAATICAKRQARQARTAKRVSIVFGD